MILTIKTDNPEAEIGLYDRSGKQLSYYSWRADRELAKTLLATIKSRLDMLDATWQDIGGLIVYEGPGSFTGLRIGITVANTLAYSLNAPIVATGGDDWIQTGLTKLEQGVNDKIAMPYYGGEAHITRPRK